MRFQVCLSRTPSSGHNFQAMLTPLQILWSATNNQKKRICRDSVDPVCFILIVFQTLLLYKLSGLSMAMVDSNNWRRERLVVSLLGWHLLKSLHFQCHQLISMMFGTHLVLFSRAAQFCFSVAGHLWDNRWNTRAQNNLITSRLPPLTLRLHFKSLFG